MSVLTETDSKYVEFIAEYYKRTCFYPSYEEIVKGMKQSKSVVFTHMQRLEDNGILVRKLPKSPTYRLINIDLIMKGKEHESNQG